jgi:hypothetical protein
MQNLLLYSLRPSPFFGQGDVTKKWKLATTTREAKKRADNLPLFFVIAPFLLHILSEDLSEDY